MPIKITYEIYSGRNSPYFEISAPEEVQNIRNRLENLPRASEQNPPANWSGSYMFELTGEESGEKQFVTVSKTSIEIQQKKSNAFFEDSKSLRKYLDGLRTKHGLIGA